MDNHAYAYIVGRLRALDTQMLNQTLLERMIDAKDAEEAFRALNDHPLLVEGMGDGTVQDFQKVLLSGLQNLSQLIKQMAPYPEVMNFLWYRYDFHNLKVVVKAKLMNQGYAEVEHALINLGSVQVEQFQKYLIEGAKIELTPELQTVLSKIEEQYEKSQDSQMIDLMLDSHYLSSLASIAELSGSEMIQGYLQRLIDFTNLRSFIRAYELKKDKAYFDSVLAAGGYTDVATFGNSYEKGYEDLRQGLERARFGEALVEVLDAFIADKSLLQGEKKVAELLQDFMSHATKVVFGPEPVIAFFLKFENHLQIIRTILVGKLNQLETNEIAASLPVL